MGPWSLGPLSIPTPSTMLGGRLDIREEFKIRHGKCLDKWPILCKVKAILKVG